MIRVEIKNEILGDSIFWEGHPEDVDELKNKNIVAHMLAKKVAKTGQPAMSGMWQVSVVA